MAWLYLIGGLLVLATIAAICQYNIFEGFKKELIDKLRKKGKEDKT